MAFTFDFGGPPFFEGNEFFSNADDMRGIIVRLDETVPVPGAATSSVSQTHTLPVGAIVMSAAYTVTAKPAGLVTIGSVAQVREGTGSELIVDFQGLRTVERVRAPQEISSIRPWAGTQFADGSLIANGASIDQQFTEILTERLLLDLSSSVGADELAAEGMTTVLSPPADLELLVNGTRAWFSAGPAKPGGSADDPAAFQTTVDLTTAVRAAVTAAPPSAETVTIDVEFRSSVPGDLALATALQFQRTFDVVFPEGGTRVIDAAEEGVYEVPLPLPDDAPDWSIHEVQMTVSGVLPPLRVLQPDGPVISGSAELVLDPDHAVLVGLPPASLAQLATLSAIRIPIGVDPGGAELAGVLRADAAGAPGDQLPDGQLGPVTLTSGDLDQPIWTTVPLGKEHKVAPGEQLWVGLQLARGKVGWPLATPEQSPEAPPLSADAPLRRQLPNGAFRQLSSAGDVPTTAGSIRIAGEPPGGSPIPALGLDVAGVAVPFTPTTAGVSVAIRLAPPLVVSDSAAALDESGALRLTMTTKVAGSISFSAVRVAYTDGGESA